LQFEKCIREIDKYIVLSESDIYDNYLIKILEGMLTLPYATTSLQKHSGNLSTLLMELKKYRLLYGTEINSLVSQKDGEFLD
jgi:hypothetical protein